MISVSILNSSGLRAPRAFTERCVARVVRELLREKISPREKKQLRTASGLLVSFLDKNQIRRLNRDFRGQDKATDILSFAPVEEGSLGELAIALDVIRLQAREHRLSLHDELGYMILHGILHLLGYDHDVSRAEAVKMFAIQDRIFDRARERW